MTQITHNGLEKNVEVVVSDNASSDNTVEVLKSYKKKYPKFFGYNVNSENVGFGNNLEKCVSLSSGKYVWTCGDDDLYNKGIVKTVTDILMNNNVDFLLLNYSDSAQNKKYVKLTNQNFECFTTKSNFLRTVKNAAGFVSCNIFRRNSYIKVQTKNTVWRHFVKLLNYPEKAKYGFFKENSIFVVRPGAGNWFKNITMFSYVTDIIYEIAKSNCTKTIKSFLLDIYRQNYFDAYVKPVVFDKRACQTDMAIINEAKDKLDGISKYCDYDFNPELFVLRHPNILRALRRISKLLTCFVFPGNTRHNARNRFQKFLERFYLKYVLKWSVK